MGKVRVPKEMRPPNRHGIYPHWLSGGHYKVAGAYRIPKVYEPFWNNTSGHVGCAMFEFSGPRVIMVECNPDGSALAQAPEAP